MRVAQGGNFNYKEERTVKLVSVLLLIAYAAVAANTGTFWVKEEGPKVSFHIDAQRWEKSEEYGIWVVSMVLAAKDVTEIQADGRVTGTRVTPDTDKHELIMEFVRTQPQLTRQELVKIVTDRLNKGKVQYKEIPQPKTTQLGKKV